MFLTLNEYYDKQKTVVRTDDIVTATEVARGGTLLRLRDGKAVRVTQELSTIIRMFEATYGLREIPAA